MKITVLFFTLLLGITSAFSQKEVDDLMKEGIELHDAGKYAEALKKYEEAAKIEPKNTTVNYEMANTYIAIEDFKKAIKYADKVIDLKSSNLDEAYMLKGTAYDMMGKAKESIKTYKEGIKVNPLSYLLHFNLGVTYLKDNQQKEAEMAFLDAIHLKPAHASSHLQLGNVGAMSGSKVKGLFGYYFYQLLNPENKFSALAYKEIQKMMPFESKKPDKPNVFEIILPKAGEDSEVSSLDLLIGMLPVMESILKDSAKLKMLNAKTAKDSAAVKEILKTIAPNNPFEAFALKNAKIFKMAGETLQKEKKDRSFWWIFYAQFFSELEKAGHTEAFSYHILKPSKNPVVVKWVENNSDKLQKMSDWIGEYPFPH
jgi:tetratricopeptide (TPR) repeat protein